MLFTSRADFTGKFHYVMWEWLGGRDGGNSGIGGISRHDKCTRPASHLTYTCAN